MQRRKSLDNRRLKTNPALRRKTKQTRLRRHGFDGRAGEEMRSFLRREIAIMRKPGQIQASRRRMQQRRKCGWRVVILSRPEKSEPLRFGAPTNRRENVDDPAPTDGSQCGLVANDQAISS